MAQMIDNRIGNEDATPPTVDVDLKQEVDTHDQKIPRCDGHTSEGETNEMVEQLSENQVVILRKPCDALFQFGHTAASILAFNSVQ